MIDLTDFVTKCAKRFDALARMDCEIEETEKRLFKLIDEVRDEAHQNGLGCGDVARQLDILAHEAEVPPPDGRDMGDQAALFRYAGVMRRAADLLRGPEKDLTPRDVSGGEARPAH
jgi:hypothetical protein